MIAVGKVMIRCSVTAEEIPTGFTAISSEMFARMPAEGLVVRCGACGQRHEWSIRDAFLR